MKTLLFLIIFISFAFAQESEQPIVKEISPVEILGKTANQAVCKFIIANDLTVDLWYADADTSYLVYADKAYRKDNLPFLLFEDEIERLLK